MKAWSAVLAVVIVVSVSVAAAAVTSKDALPATGQNVLNPYNPYLVQGGKVYYSITNAPIRVGPYEIFDHGVVLIQKNLVDGSVVVIFPYTNHYSSAVTVSPYMTVKAPSDSFRTGVVPSLPSLPSLHNSQFAGASQGCPASGPSVNPGFWITPALPSAADGTHDSTPVTMSFQVSTLNISNSTKAINNEPIVSTSVINTFLKLHPEVTKTDPAANQAQLKQSLCSVTTQIGTIYGKNTTLQPGQSAMIESTTNSSNWGFSCSPVSSALINYNVQAGSTTYQALKTPELIVFSPQESNICGT